MAKVPINTEELADLALLVQVVKHNETFYPSGWPRYRVAHAREFSCGSRKERIDARQVDYENIAPMIFVDPPTFDEIMDRLAGLEKRSTNRDT